MVCVLSIVSWVLLVNIIHFDFTLASTCAETEIWTDCGTACPLTCDQPKPRACTEQCVEGCVCRKGYIRDTRTSQCILARNCGLVEGSIPEACEGKENEAWSDCGTACPRTCSYRYPRACTLQCVPGCFCLEGFVRDTRSGRCISPDDCRTD